MHTKSQILNFFLKLYSPIWIFFSASNICPPRANVACPNEYGLIFHSDQGSEYTAFAFRQLLGSCNIVQSFSKKGYPFDNACCESFFKYLKKNRTNRRFYHTPEELRLDIFDYIENLYNNRLPHGSKRLCY
jgi:transposase InsO family protein